MTEHDVSHVFRELENYGYAYLNCEYTESDFAKLCGKIGKTINRTIVTPDAGSSSYVMGTKQIPFHTDHPKASYIAWRCIVNDGVGIKLLDFFDFLKCYSTVYERVKDVEHLVPYVEGVEYKSWQNLITLSGGQRVYFAPWLVKNQKDKSLIFSLTNLLNSYFKKHGTTIPIESCSVLIIDNTRILHGRNALGSNSERALDRRWIVSH